MIRPPDSWRHGPLEDIEREAERVALLESKNRACCKNMRPCISGRTTGTPMLHTAVGSRLSNCV
jgi:hypothetical protein